jgi:hypothetical protein
MLRHVRNLREDEILARPQSMADGNKPDGKGADETENDPFLKRIFDRGEYGRRLSQGH